ncbi:RNA polymerase sigma factor [Pseudofrankia inefficax]|uniref:RNA polymerase sigma factor n=1 Tax=Pseudofrankia inefficax (strain DSM 45817 / CECT 9037 / DDB 130130 / EuI1c) TaxID=298654 RepID=UPI0001BFB9A3|nr:RNA polymerase subunit sigma-70 [Pseudofrankia inefficax]
MPRPAASSLDAADGETSRLQRVQEPAEGENAAGGHDVPVQLSQLADLESEDSPNGKAARAAAELLARRLDSLPRRAIDAQLRNDLALAGFEGPDYDLFQHELSRYALQVMLAWIGKGTIFFYCAQKGIYGLRSERDEDTRLTPDDVEELAFETVARALPAFRRAALVNGGWTLEGGATLKTYFVGTCLYEFANTYRLWNREQRRWHSNGDAEAIHYNQTWAAAADPEDIVIALDTVRRLLSKIPNERTQLVLALATDGYTHSEIAEILADGSTPRAVEGLLSRHRRTVQGQERSQ